MGSVDAQTNGEKKKGCSGHVELRGNSTTCAYTLDSNIVETNGSCSYQAAYEVCETTGSPNQRSCDSSPAQMYCECPIKWNHLNSIHNVLTLYPASFRKTSDVDKENINTAEALQSYDVNLNSLCASAKECHRFDCDEGGCCALELLGHPEGIQDYCDEESCYAQADEAFDCVTLNGDSPQGVLLYGGSIAQMREWNDAHVNFFFLLTLILGSIGVTSAILAGYCCVKNRATRRENASEAL